MINKFDIDKEWKNSNMPVSNGILYADGTISKIYVLLEGKKRKLKKGEIFDINDLINAEKIDIVEVAVLKKVEDFVNNITVYCGMGFLGGDGFVAVKSKADLKIKWCAFFEESNPFENIEIIDNKIVAYNNLNEKWIFDIDNPTNVMIEQL